MKWTGGEDERRTIEENLRKWKQHLEDHTCKSPREHLEKAGKKGIRPSMPAWSGNFALIDNER